jgi:acetate kinase
MILLLEGDNNNLYRYGLVGKDGVVETGIRSGAAAMKRTVLVLKNSRGINRIGYRVVDGGSRFNRTVMERTASLTERLGESSLIAVDNDRRMKELIDFCWEHCVDCRHYILSDTAFFTALPEASRTFAIPFELTEQGLHKYGRDGILHGWALKKYAGLGLRPADKVITILLNDRTNVVASRNGQPVAVSNGFAGTDGILSRTGCGWIDTSIVFRMFASGFSHRRIRKVLSEASGFKAFLGGSFGLRDILSRQDARSRFAQDVFSYQLLKCIGAYAAVLDGIGAIVFIGEGRKEMKGWVQGFLTRMAVLGLQIKSARSADKRPLLTAAGSRVCACYFATDQWQAMADLITERSSP